MKCQFTHIYILFPCDLCLANPQAKIEFPLKPNLTLVWPVPLAQVLPRPQLIFPFKTWFFGNLFEFSAAEITQKSISPTF
jgi:hypothetical protein